MKPSEKSSKVFLRKSLCTVFSWTSLLTCHRVKRVPDQTGLLPHEPCRLKHRSFFYKSMETKIILPKPHAPNLSYLPLIILINDTQNPRLNTVPCDFTENTARTPYTNSVTVMPICKQTFGCSVPAWGGTFPMCLLRTDTHTRSKIS